jgi:hypothetical protein
LTSRSVGAPRMFRSQVLPLKAKRSIRVQADLAEEAATRFHPGPYEFEGGGPQMIHFEPDCSRLAAEVILSNDARGGQPASS